MGAWDVVYCKDDMNIIRSTWDFKLKRYPGRLIKNFKDRFCARGYMQLKVIDLFETYAPVVQWTTVCLILILEILLQLKSNQGDITAAFLHEKLEENEKIFSRCRKYLSSMTNVEMKWVLRLKNTIYVPCQSPRLCV